MELFNFKDPMHKKILREEIVRLKKILKEGYQYSVDEIWDAMSDQERYEAIAATRDDEGPDLADRYADGPWDDIPADIQDTINLNDYQLAKYQIGGGSANLRAIENFKTKNPDDAKLVDQFVKKVGRKDFRSLTVKQSYKLLLAIHELHRSVAAKQGNAGSVLPTSQRGDDSINPYDMPGGRPSRGYMGAKYTGD
jgi:hypothetical protein